MPGGSYTRRLARFKPLHCTMAWDKSPRIDTVSEMPSSASSKGCTLRFWLPHATDRRPTDLA